jgi:3-dehydroquinate dehydratase II
MSRPIMLMLHGPNFEMLGKREPEIYGDKSLADHVAVARRAADENGYDLEDFQSSSEAELIAAIHGARERCAAIVINAGAFTHYAWSLHDALAIFDGVIVELHISNPNARESWRHTSVIAPVAHGTVMGFGIDGYRLAVEGAARKVAGRVR